MGAGLGRLIYLSISVAEEILSDIVNPATVSYILSRQLLKIPLIFLEKRNQA
jgi:hypothetical protein